MFLFFVRWRNFFKEKFFELIFLLNIFDVFFNKTFSSQKTFQTKKKNNPRNGNISILSNFLINKIELKCVEIKCLPFKKRRIPLVENAKVWQNYPYHYVYEFALEKFTYSIIHIVCFNDYFFFLGILPNSTW